MLLQGYGLILITFEYYWDFKILFLLSTRKNESEWEEREILVKTKIAPNLKSYIWNTDSGTYCNNI